MTKSPYGPANGTRKMLVDGCGGGKGGGETKSATRPEPEIVVVHPASIATAATTTAKRRTPAPYAQLINPAR